MDRSPLQVNSLRERLLTASGGSTFVSTALVLVRSRLDRSLARLTSDIFDLGVRSNYWLIFPGRCRNFRIRADCRGAGGSRAVRENALQWAGSAAVFLPARRVPASHLQ